MTHQSFGSLVANARGRLGITHDLLAERIGVSRPTISRIEGGRRSPSVEVFVALIQELALDATEAVHGVGVRNAHANRAARQQPPLNAELGPRRGCR